MSGVYIPNMEMPKGANDCEFSDEFFTCSLTNERCALERMGIDCPLVFVPDHGRLIDADALIEDMKRQCREVFKIDAVSPDDFWITRNEAYNERLWKTWCESFYEYLKTAPTIIPAEEAKE